MSQGLDYLSPPICLLDYQLHLEPVTYLEGVNLISLSSKGRELFSTSFRATSVHTYCPRPSSHQTIAIFYPVFIYRYVPPWSISMYASNLSLTFPWTDKPEIGWRLYFTTRLNKNSLHSYYFYMSCLSSPVYSSQIWIRSPSFFEVFSKVSISVFLPDWLI